VRDFGKVAALLLLPLALSCATMNLSGSGLTSPFAAIDAHALAAPAEVTRSAETLAAYLVAPARNDMEKARAIFRWIAANIDYNMDAARSGGDGGGADEALKSRSAVCAGFSDLYSRLAKAAGLEAVSISGWARGMNYTVGDPAGATPNHAWNAVKIEGRWILVDSTWGAGAVDETGVYRRRFDPWYFDPPPSELQCTHLPADPRWQLVSEPISGRDFTLSPYLRSAFFARGLELVSPHSCWIVSSAGPVEVILTRRRGAFITARLYRGEERLPQEWVKISQENSRVVVKASTTGAGTYILRIFAGDVSTTQGNVRHFEWAADFRIDNRGPESAF
jgi:transglutaminase/protease-like cytokinesis protein 3